MIAYSPQGYQQYLKVHAETAGPGELLLMLYGGLVRFLLKARAAMGQGDREASHQSLLRAQEAVAELMSSLDLDSGELARKLMGVYTYFYRRLVEANCEQDPGAVDEVLDLTQQLASAWRTALQGGMDGH